MAFTAGQILTAGDLNAAFPLVAIKTVDEVVNNTTTFQADNELLWSVAANGIYQFDLKIKYESGTTPDIKLNWTVPSGTTMLLGSTGYNTAGTFGQLGSTTETDDIGLGGLGIGTFPWSHTYGIVTVSSTAGTVTLRWAQNTANASNTTVKAGSHGSMLKLN